MIKCFCDKCGKETTADKIRRIIENDYACDMQGVKIIGFPVAAHDLCKECYEKYQKLNIDTDDFMAMTDEDIELALYTFKIGDQVITDDGRVGTITDICTCEQCKKRGFYEPRVEIEIGLYDIYITDSDKNNGFKSFYRIGDQVFGNVDEEESERIKDGIRERKLEIISLEGQLNVLKKLKQVKE